MSREEEILKEIREIKEYIIGKPGQDGLVTRVDRLEVSERIRNWILGSLFVGLISVVAKLVFR